MRRLRLVQIQKAEFAGKAAEPVHCAVQQPRFVPVDRQKPARKVPVLVPHINPQASGANFQSVLTRFERDYGLAEVENSGRAARGDECLHEAQQLLCVRRRNGPGWAFMIEFCHPMYPFFKAACTRSSNALSGHSIAVAENGSTLL